MTTFAELGLSDAVLAAVDHLGYTEPTPVQAQAIPLVLQGRDIIAAAKTGTGKTAAFSLPSLDVLARAERKKAPAMLVITPTRELAMQIQEVCQTIARTRGLRVANVVGGVKIEPQIDRLARGVDVLIATPGRLIDLMNQKAVDLSQVQVLVLDEADRMLDMGFLPSVRRIVEATPKSRQTLLFSATIDKGVLDQVDAMLDDPAIVQIAAKGETADTVEQYIAHVPHTLKPDLLAALLKERGHKRVIVFARTRHRADAACRKLKRAGYHAEAIHSDRSQNQRKRALDNFASGETDILVATDVLARGIEMCIRDRACCGSPTGVSRARRNRQGPRRGPRPYGPCALERPPRSPVWRQAEPRRRGAPRDIPRSPPRTGAPRGRARPQGSRPHARGRSGASPRSAPRGRHRPARPLPRTQSCRQTGAPRPPTRSSCARWAPPRRARPRRTGPKREPSRPQGPPRPEPSPCRRSGRTRRYRSWWTYQSLGAPVPFSFHLRGILRICRPRRHNCPIIAQHPPGGTLNSCPRSSGDRALASGARCRRFESCRGHHLQRASPAPAGLFHCPTAGPQ